MASSPLLPPVTVGEFLEWETRQEGRFELSSGRILSMAGAGEPHRSITPALSRICGQALRGRPCRYFDQDTKIAVEAAGASYYADGGIACPPNLVSRSTGAIDNPTVIFEVLSPSTEARDRGEKFLNYRLLPSLRDYVLIGTDRPLVEVFSRQPDGNWLLRIYLEGATAHLPSVGVDLPLAELYEDAVFS